jgi:hypothetical protein
MENENENEIENQDVETIEGDQTAEPTVGTKNEEGVETPEYQPNLEFSVKNEKFTFDERLLPVIKDKETEDFLRDTFTKAYGLDGVKSKLEATEREFGEIRQKFQSLEEENRNYRSGLERLNQLKEQDPLGFQKEWGLNDNWILKRATEILEHQENPQLRSAAERAHQDRMQAYQYEQNFQREAERSRHMERQIHLIKMNQAMSNPEVSDFAKAFDQKMGAGAFEREVSDYGTLQFHQNRYIDPQDAVSQVYGRLKNIFSVSQPTPQSLNPESPSQQDIPVSRIPNLGRGKSGTPTTKRFNTVEALRAHAASLG